MRGQPPFGCPSSYLVTANKLSHHPRVPLTAASRTPPWLASRREHRGRV